MKVELHRLKVHKKTSTIAVPQDIIAQGPIASFTISQGEKRKLDREIHDLNSIFAGGKMNVRYKLVRK